LPHRAEELDDSELWRLRREAGLFFRRLRTDYHGLSGPAVLARTWTVMREDDVFGKAAQLAYYFFLALFPFLIFVVASLSALDLADNGRVLLFTLFARFLPGAAFELVQNTFDEMLRAGGPLRLSLGLLVSLWSASLGMSAVMDTLNAAHNVKENRSVFRQYAIAIALTCTMGILLMATVITVLAGDAIIDFFGHEGFIMAGWRFAQWPLSIVLLLIAFAITYYFAPDLLHRPQRPIVPGLFLGSTLFFLVCVGLRMYLRYFGRYNMVYGSLGAVIVLLLWFYFSGVALLTGGVLNGVLDSLQIAKEAKPTSSTS
jgi:membrane protein